MAGSFQHLGVEFHHQGKISEASKGVLHPLEHLQLVPFGVHLDDGRAGRMVSREGIDCHGVHFDLVHGRGHGVGVETVIVQEREMLNRTRPSQSDAALWSARTPFTPFRSMFRVRTV